jgi:outer membrane lipoprotein-sorting protein
MRIFLILFFICAQVWADSKVNDILKRMDKLYKSDTSMAIMTMKIVNPDWEREMKMKAWTKGLENSFITILYPNKDKGISTLKKDKEMWNYFPKINKVIKVPPSMMMGSWMGSDFTNDDLVKENTYLDDHVSKLVSSENGIYEIELVPKRDTVSVWGKIVLKIEKKRLIPLEESFYNEKGEKVREILFDKVKKIGKNDIPLRLTLTPLKKQGHKTIVEYTEIKFDIKIPENTFSRKNLQKRR